MGFWKYLKLLDIPKRYDVPEALRFLSIRKEFNLEMNKNGSIEKKLTVSIFKVSTITAAIAAIA